MEGLKREGLKGGIIREPTVPLFRGRTQDYLESSFRNTFAAPSCNPSAYEGLRPSPVPTKT